MSVIATAALAILIPAAAQAHASIWPRESKAGAVTTLTPAQPTVIR